MLALISPAKTLDYETALPTDEFTQPRLLEHSAQLIDVCRKLSASEIANLMSVSEKIATLNADRFRDWNPEFNFSNARQAIYAFKGDVYTGLDAYHLKDKDIDFAQQHLRMLSGLYGLLCPLDLMMPYRLEMGTKLKNTRGHNLYEFWGDIITNQINEDLAAIKSELLENGKYKVISFYAKKARGLMARFIIENQLNKAEDLKAFNTEGYYFDADNSSAKELVFKRDEQ